MGEGCGLFYIIWKDLLIIMNKKNQDLFFNEDREETILLTITDANGTEFDVEPIANMEIEELNKE